MDLSAQNETAYGARDVEELSVNSDSSAASERFCQAAYDGLLGEQPAKESLAKLMETDRSAAEKKTDKVERIPPASTERGQEQSFGDLQGQVPEAYLRYMSRYKDAGNSPGKPGPDLKPTPDVNPVAPVPKPDQPKPQPAPDQPKPQPGPDQPKPGPGKVLPGIRPEPAPRPEVKPEPRPNPGVNPNPQPQPAPRPCPKPG